MEGEGVLVISNDGKEGKTVRGKLKIVIQKKRNKEEVINILFFLWLWYVVKRQQLATVEGGRTEREKFWMEQI